MKKAKILKFDRNSTTQWVVVESEHGRFLLISDKNTVLKESVYLPHGEIKYYTQKNGNATDLIRLDKQGFRVIYKNASLKTNTEQIKEFELKFFKL